MQFLSSINWRRGALAVFAVAFAAASLLSDSRTAQMQTASNTIVFDRYDADLGYTQVYVMNADGTDVTPLGRGFAPVWSGDGTRIAYGFGNSETSDVWTMNADGTNKTQLTQNYNSYAPAWSPDGTRVAFASYHQAGDHVYIINADGTNQQKLIHNAVGVTREFAPTWSADGTKVIFLGEKVVEGLARYDYYAANASNDGGTVQLTFVNALFDLRRPAVSADGTKLVAEYQHELQAIAADPNVSPVNLTNSAANYGTADYAPGGSKIVYTRGKDLYVMNADGSNQTPLGVIGDNADWNPTAVVSQPTPTPTATPVVTADLAVYASVSPATVAVGGTANYSVSVHNNGTADANNVTLTATLPSNISAGVPQASQGSCMIAGGQLTCQLGKILNGSSVAVNFSSTAAAVGYASAQFIAAALETDPDANNNSATANLTVTGPCAAPVTTPIEITRWQWRRDDRSGQDELILTIRNRSDQNLDPRLIFVFDNLTAGVSIDESVIAGRTSCAPPIGSPFLIGSAPNGREWKPMQTVSIRVLFNNPSRGPITFDWRLYSGNVNP